MGDDKVMKLAKRLQGLIHLAEQRRDDARRQVRMAEDSSAAKSEGQGLGEDSQSQGDDQVSIQCYNGPEQGEHWIRFANFTITRL